MNLVSRIRKIEDPKFFKRLVNLIFSAEEGKNFQITKDLGDFGIDGYLKSEKAAFSVYCPEYPEKRTSRRYKDKIKKDLSRLGDAVKGGWDIKGWIFLTPEDLPVDVITFIDNKTKTLGYFFETITASRLAVLLLKHRELHKELPELRIGNLKEKVPNIYINLVKNRGHIMVEVFNDGDEDIKDLNTEILDNQVRNFNHSYLYQEDDPLRGHTHTCFVLRKGERQYINNVPNQMDFTISITGIGVESGEQLKIVKPLKKISD